MPRRSFLDVLWSVLLVGLVMSVVTAPVTASMAPVAAAGQVQTPTGEEVIERVEQRYGNAETIAGRAVVTTSNATETSVANLSIAYAAPNSTRFVVERDNETARFGTNGTVTWAVTPRGSVIRDADAIGPPYGEETPESVEAAALTVPTSLNASSLEATVLGSEMINSTETYQVRIDPEDDANASATTLWVATDDYRVLRVETMDATTTTTVEVTDLFFNVSIHESTFQPPRDRIDRSSFERYDTFAAAQAGTALDLPTFDAGRFVDASVSVQLDDTVVTQRYVLDGQNVTVVSSTATEQFDRFADTGSPVQIDGRNATVSTTDGGSVVAWTDGEVTTVVVVKGSADDAVEVARRL